jgi:hypothetical protein
MCIWNNPLLNHDQIFKWCSSHCNGGNNVSIHKLRFVFQFHEVFVIQFSPYQFRIVIKCGYETIIHSIKCTMNLHPDWVILQLDVANAFNFVSRGVIFQELCVANGDIIQFIPFVCVFYAFKSPFFYNHHNRETNVKSIPSTTRMRQGDPLGGHYSL